MLVQADGDRSWPVKTRSVAIVFASRVAHLLDSDHVVEEARRVCLSGGCFLVGRVERTGLKKELQREREVALTRRGLTPVRAGRRRTQALIEALLAGGGAHLVPRPVASWTVTTTAEEVIAAWEGMPTMAGRPIDPDVRREVLGELREWAGERYGGLDNPEAVSETYTLEGVRLL